MNWEEILKPFASNLPFLVTVVVVLSAATVTYRSNRRSVESQNQLAEKARDAAHQDKISEFRHKWLQEVRETSADLAKVYHDCRINHFLKEREFEFSIKMSGTPTGNEEHLKNCELYESKFINSRLEFYKLSSKLFLLFKPRDPQVIELTSKINEITLSLKENPSRLSDDDIEFVLCNVQKLLKHEWEVTKSRSWQKNT
ncbi:hypothetical protein [Vibrio parahaemolyticus]|uniref:hypothetical protein n=2 Tax=Vibrio parahaemolyticus TaxID=670 RepID=UPI00046E750C|nr:hypothetical protein [Vibrio parahaemolyticus]EGR1394014.1 hypothetical protein [Vibrio parahaemolyticus]EGR2692144.1 hypothetical protein [Vibrio parahaemolyticus]EGR2708025.1 hypothetical protein [Vibrio parahaemolyticus]EJG0413161.1 hypothetical protein [Vibrio parahaemolyticus]EJM7154285.1 hypothetical protein [Vibrio parahaemolyticus]